jgi:hypothetical protein
MSVDLPIGLDTSAEELTRRLSSLIRREARLFNMGTTCPIKDSSETSCLACPLSQVGQDCVKAGLCETGCEQERVQTLLLAKQHSGR